MKINEIIKIKRKEQKLTQEQVAEYLGVSTPAVNKWEKGSTYPDITILPALARLLKVDLNTLLSFNEDLSRIEMGNFTNEITVAIQEKGYAEAFEKAMDKIKEYPNSELLILSVAMTMQGSLTVFHIEDTKKYEEKIEELYLRISESSDLNIRSQANSMLICKYMDKEDYEKAQQLIDTLQDNVVDKKQMKIRLAMKQENNEEALKLLEEKLLTSAMDIQATLLCMLDIASKEKRFDDAEVYADIADKTVNIYDLWNYNSYAGRFQLAIAKKDSDKSIEILNNMIVEMKKPWKISSSRLYGHIKEKDNDESFANMMIQGMICELENDETLGFLRKNPKFKDLINKYKVMG